MGGLWKGTLTQAPGGCFPTYNLELQIKVVEKKVTGVCYHYSDTKNYVKKNFEGEYNSFTKSISIKETDLIALHIPGDCTPCVKSYDLWYSNNRKETLSGDWVGFVLDTKAACQPGHIVLSRIQESAFAGIQEIMVDTGNIRLEFYDNGEIDNDSISVVVNNKAVLSNEKLGARPVTLNIRMDNNKQMQEVIMQAENLGSIPPNTALLIVTTGKKRYKLYLTSTDKRNAAVRFIYDPSEGPKKE
jgi:CRISPR/Cas system-associated endoribonuclease Cas2